MKNIFNYPAIDLTPWYKKWFNTSFYHKLYAHRSDEEAAGFIDELFALLKPAPGSSMLDVGCGNGRHCRQIGKQFPVTGIDIATSSIKEANRHATDRMGFYVHDMRMPFGNECYSHVFNFFTSFGYFENEAEQLSVLRNMMKALKPGGKFVLDYLNIVPAERNLVAYERKDIDDVFYHIKRWMDDKYFYKQISITEFLWSDPLIFTEKVARLGLEDFKKMFTACGLELLTVRGDYELNLFDEGTSPRLILIAEKA